MDNIFGKSQIETTSGLIHSRTLRLTLEALLLMGLGALAVLMHARLRSPISVPGHHGIEFMALLLLGRLSSNLKFASTISSFGIGLLLLFPVLGFRDPLMGFNCMLPGFLLDICYLAGGNLSKKIWFVVLIAGLSYMMIPISRLIITAFTGYQYGSFLKYGPIVPVLSHFAFGLSGGLFGTGISKLLNKLFSKFLQ
jgi:hypothetical protein